MLPNLLIEAKDLKQHACNEEVSRAKKQWAAAKEAGMVKRKRGIKIHAACVALENALMASRCFKML